MILKDEAVPRQSANPLLSLVALTDHDHANMSSAVYAGC